MRVVVCDDSTTIRMVIVDLLQRIGLDDIQQCSNGREALDLAKRGEVDILLIDIHMPEMDGMSCVEEIRTDSGSLVTTIFISSDTDPAQFARARELGAFGFIKKPFRVEGVRRAIEEAVKETQRRSPVEAEPEPVPVEAGAGAEPPSKSNKNMLKWLRRVFPGR